MKTSMYLLAGIAASLLSGCQTTQTAHATDEAAKRQSADGITVTTTQLANGATVTNYETAGNLKSTHAVGCVAVDKLMNTYTPADLYPAQGKCIAMGDYKNALVINALAGVYTRFDTLRVADESAHDAGQVLMMQVASGIPEERRKAFLQNLRETINDPAALKAVCAQIKKIGRPNYFPDYMIQHGMGAFTGSQKGLVANFDAAAAWKSSLDSYLHCPQD
jgi:hypothetical protein